MRNYQGANYRLHSRLSPSLVAIWATIIATLLAAELIPVLVLTVRRMSYMLSGHNSAITLPLVFGCIAVMLQILCAIVVGRRIHHVYNWRDDYCGTGLKVLIWVCVIFLFFPWSAVFAHMAQISTSLDALYTIYVSEVVRFFSSLVFIVLFVLDWMDYRQYCRQEGHEEDSFWTFSCEIFNEDAERAKAEQEAASHEDDE